MFVVVKASETPTVENPLNTVLEGHSQYVYCLLGKYHVKIMSPQPRTQDILPPTSAKMALALVSSAT